MSCTAGQGRSNFWWGPTAWSSHHTAAPSHHQPSLPTCIVTRPRLSTSLCLGRPVAASATPKLLFVSSPVVVTRFHRKAGQSRQARQEQAHHHPTAHGATQRSELPFLGHFSRSSPFSPPYKSYGLSETRTFLALQASLTLIIYRATL
ncbi:hypothetical protein LZ30DRAFT_175937 [Colletotrichum cereale]|nr:hypothetical protein LZ30DRAFT_175937 [Colletotrichum cereale]